MFVDVLFGVLPLFFLMLAGYGASYSKRFASVEPALNVFVFYAALPALLYQVVARADISGGVPSEFLWGSAGAALLSAVLFWAIFRYLIRLGRARSLAGMLTASFGNVSYLGIPVILGVLGPQAGFAAGMGQLVHNVIFMVGFPVLAQIALPATQASGQRPNFGRILRTIRAALLYNPVTWAMLAGGAVVTWQIHLPSPVDATVDMLAAAAAPGALFTIGLSLRRTVQRLSRTRVVPDSGEGQRGASSAMLIMVLGKLLVLPLLTVGVLRLFAPQLDAVWFNAAVLMAAVPTSATAYIMAQTDTGDGEPTALAIVITCALSLLTLPLLAQLFMQ
ncbi:AEC family transporter [Glutamicibacter uratoxydans]|uniref:AEC family transporter n=1 Tax=Glutamicibacter uratoxydans TaxID=43667 RepID=UPI003D6DDEC0